MKNIILICTFLIVVGTFATLVHAEGYRYIDESGNIIFVDRLEQVPQKYRYQVLPTPTPDAGYSEEKKSKAQRDYERKIKKAEQARERAEKEKQRKLDQEEKRKQRELERKQREEDRKQAQADKKAKREERESGRTIDGPQPAIVEALPPPRSSAN